MRSPISNWDRGKYWPISHAVPSEQFKSASPFFTLTALDIDRKRYRGRGHCPNSSHAGEEFCDGWVRCKPLGPVVNLHIWRCDLQVTGNMGRVHALRNIPSVRRCLPRKTVACQHDRMHRGGKQRRRAGESQASDTRHCVIADSIREFGQACWIERGKALTNISATTNSNATSSPRVVLFAGQIVAIKCELITKRKAMSRMYC